MSSSHPAVEGPIPALTPSAEASGIESYGYREDEFFLSGSANVYAPHDEVHRSDAPRGNNPFTQHELDFSVVARAGVPYTTRVLVRRPVADTAFSGVVYLEPLHVVFERGMSWRKSRAWILRTGGAWVGVTASSGLTDDGRRLGGVRYLQERDPERYATLFLDDGEPERWPLLRSGRDASGAGLSSFLADGDWWKRTSYNEAFARVGHEMSASYSHSPDVLLQVAGLLKAGDGAGLLGGVPAAHVYASGGMLTGKYWNMFLQGGLHGRDDGRPLIDAYMLLGASPPPGMPVPDDAPVIELHGERETAVNSLAGVAVPDDSDSPRRRYYEIAGTGHQFTGPEPDKLVEDWARPSGSARAGSSAHRDADGEDGDAHLPHNMRPNAPLLHAIWSNLDRSVRDGTPMPSAAPIARDAAAPDGIARDDDGNAIGGVRSPWIAVPDARFLPACPVHPNDGTIEVFTAPQRAARGLDAATYIDRIGSYVDDLIARRWVLPEDANVYTDHAELVVTQW